jgi:hypothetical protein
MGNWEFGGGAVLSLSGCLGAGQETALPGGGDDRFPRRQRVNALQRALGS